MQFVLACPLTATTTGIVNTTLLALMRPTGVLINIVRGPVVDETALYEGAQGDRRRGAGHVAVWGLDEGWDEGPSVVAQPVPVR